MIFDDLARQYGLTPRRPDVEATQMLPTYQPPRPRPPQPPQACARCVERDRPLVLIHRHLDEATGNLHHRISHMEALIMSALDNLTAQVDNISQTLSGTVEPALAALAEKAATSTGIPEDAVQAQADRLSTIASSAASATQTALAQGGASAPPQG